MTSLGTVLPTGNLSWKSISRAASLICSYGAILNTRISLVNRASGCRYLNTSSEVAAARGPAVTKGSFLAGAHHELSVALTECQGSVHRGCANLMARAAGRQVSPGAEVPL